MESVVCNLCGTADSTTLYTLPDYLLDRKDATAIFVQCNSCGLIYQNPRPTLEEMRVHYPREYDSYSAKPPKSWLAKQAFDYGLTKRARLVARSKCSGRLLDIGCSTGDFLRQMAEDGAWEPFGVEWNEYPARIACERYGLNVKVGTLEQAAFADEFFDVVTLWDVMEHFHNPVASLREIHRVLKADGLLIIRLPNANSRDAKLFGCCWAGWDPPRHLYVFTPSTLKTLLRNAGFSDSTWSSGSGGNAMFNLSLRFCAASQPRLERFNLLTRLFQNPIVQLLTAPVFYLRGHGLKGSLMIVMATKSGAKQDD